MYKPLVVPVPTNGLQIVETPGIKLSKIVTSNTTRTQLRNSKIMEEENIFNFEHNIVKSPSQWKWEHAAG
jgi:hypothetical protein